MALIEAAIFDLDGTLFDHRGSVRSALHDWLPTLGAQVHEATIAAWFAAESRHFPAWQQGLISFGEQRRRRLRDFLPLIDLPPDAEDDQLDRTFAGYLAAYEANWRAYDDARSALALLRERGLTIAVLTNGATHQQRAKVEAIGLTELAGPVFTAQALGVAKPNRTAFTRTCSHLGLDPSRALYVGDDHTVDVLAARAAGLPAVHLDREHSGPAGEIARITTLTELSDHLDTDR